MQHFALAAAPGVGRGGVVVEVPGAWAVEEVAVTGEEIGEVEMMVATGVTDIQIGGWGWWVGGMDRRWTKLVLEFHNFGGFQKYKL